MTWKPENQLTIFDVLEQPYVDVNVKYVEEKHLDPAASSELLVCYLKATGKNIGDPFKRDHAQQWVDEQMQNYRQSKGLREFELLHSIPNWKADSLIYMKEIAKILPQLKEETA